MRVTSGKLSIIATVVVILLLLPAVRIPNTFAIQSFQAQPLVGDTLPFLAQATYLGPADPSQKITVGFYFNSSRLPAEPNISTTTELFTDWESVNGLVPGVSGCSVKTSVINLNGSASPRTESSYCTTNKLKTVTTIGQAEKLFGVDINLYRYNNQTFYANPTNPLVPINVNDGSLVDIEGLNNYSSLIIRTQDIGGITSIIPSDVFGFYDLSNMFSAGVSGAGTTIDIVGDPEYGITLSDVTFFWNNYNIPWSSLNEISLSGGLPPTAGGGSQELTLDSEWAGSTGQKATINVVTTNGPSTENSVQQWFDILNAIVSHYSPDVMSSSVSIILQGATNTQLNEIFDVTSNAMVNGTTILAASGDSGYNNSNSALSADPYVTSVGGTSDTLNPPGKNPGITGETGWDDSGGGQNTYYNQPEYQLGGAITAPHTGYRDFPDIAFPSAPSIAIYFQGGFVGGYGGTSFATPMMAGIIADADSYVRSQTGSANWRTGFLNPMLYDLGYGTFYGYKAFNDITTGNNGQPAGTGWDYVTGIGSVDAWNLVRDIYDFYIQPNTAMPSTFRDTFSSGLGSWSLWGSNSYSLSTDSGTGEQAPAALISGDGFNVQSGMQKSLTLSVLPTGTPYILSFWWRAQSTYSGSSTTNAQVQIIDSKTQAQLYQDNLVEGGTTDTGWNYFYADVSNAVSGHTSITIILYLHDYWSANWNEKNWYDDVSLSTHILNDQFSNSLGGWILCGNSGYQVSRDTSNGDPAPSALISGDSNQGGLSGMITTVQWSGSGAFDLLFEWRAQSGYASSSVTNAQIQIWDANTQSLLFDQNLIEGGVYDSGWHTANIDASYFVQGHSKLFIQLYLNDYWSANWNQKNWYDNIVLIAP